MSANGSRHFLGLSNKSNHSPIAYFHFIEDLCHEARIVPQPIVNYCQPSEGNLAFSARIQDIEHGGLSDLWNDLMRPLGRTFAFIGDAIEMDVPPGAQYNKIARATFAHPNDPPSYHSLTSDERHELQSLLLTLSNLLRRLRSICQVIHPDWSNLSSFGNDIADTIILSATTCEGILKSTLLANDTSLKADDRLSTNHYSRLIEPLQLPSYSVAFRDFPWLSAISPFKDWTQTEPTRSLQWYDAYNRIKHSRYVNLSSARLDHCFCSVAAVYVLICSQFGYGEVQHRYREVGEAMSFTKIPQWKSSQLYLHPIARKSEDRDAQTWYRVALFN